MTEKEKVKLFYAAMKAETKKRKIKLSPEGDIYKKVDPYFFHAYHFLSVIEDGKAEFAIDVSVKYHRFDELHHNIICPEEDFRFTDKIRANSGAHCPDRITPRFEKEFECDWSEEAIIELAVALLDFLTEYIHGFLKSVNERYGSLSEYYIANKDTNPYLAALAYLDKGDHDSAVECLMRPNVGGERSLWSVSIDTDEQRKRALANGITKDYFYRSQNAQYKDYAIALRKGLEWTRDRAFYGLLPEERD